MIMTAVVAGERGACCTAEATLGYGPSTARGLVKGAVHPAAGLAGRGMGPAVGVGKRRRGHGERRRRRRRGVEVG